MVERMTLNHVVAGSIPAVGELTVILAAGYAVISKGGLAQSEERNVSNVEAPGSKPGFSIESSWREQVIFLPCSERVSGGGGYITHAVKNY